MALPANPRGVRVQVFTSQIAGLFEPGGQAGQFGATLRRQIFYEAVATTPGAGHNRSGFLKTQHYDGGQLKIGRYGARGFVGNSASYAYIVHQGHPEPIFPHGKKLLVPRGRYGLPARRLGWAPGMPIPKGIAMRDYVRGQDAQPWIDRAGQKIVARYVG